MPAIFRSRCAVSNNRMTEVMRAKGMAMGGGGGEVNKQKIGDLIW
jgi:hypothetical protein